MSAVEPIEARLARIRTTAPGVGLRTRVLANARDEWRVRARERRSLRLLAWRWGVAVAAVWIVCLAWAAREDALTRRALVAARPASPDRTAAAVAGLMTDIGLNGAYARLRLASPSPVAREDSWGTLRSRWSL